MKDAPGYPAFFKLLTRENPEFGAAYSVFLAPKSWRTFLPPSAGGFSRLHHDPNLGGLSSRWQFGPLLTYRGCRSLFLQGSASYGPRFRAFVSGRERRPATGWGFMHRMIGATGQSPREDRRLVALILVAAGNIRADTVRSIISAREALATLLP